MVSPRQRIGITALILLAIGIGALRISTLIKPSHSAAPLLVPVYLAVDGHEIWLHSQGKTPGEILAQAGILLAPGDVIIHDGQPVPDDQELPIAASYTFHVKRGVRVSLQAGADSRDFTTTAATLGQALAEAGISLNTADRLEPPASTRLHPVAEGGMPLTAHLERARQFKVITQGKHLQFYAAAATVGAALAEVGLGLQGDDYSLPAPGTALEAGMSVRLVRVQEQVIIEQEPLPFETEMAPAPDVELDSRKVIQPGEPGLTAKSTRVRFEDGVEVSRQAQDTWVVKQPQKRIIGYGTKIVVRTLNTPDGPIEYWRAVTMYATSYSPCRIFKDRCDSYTALGKTLQKGIVAMTNYWCRTTCGDRVYVPGYGVGLVADTGGGIPGRYWIDLGYSDSDYVSWHQDVTVYFLTPVPSNLMWVLP